jgi:hypothetical protein
VLIALGEPPQAAYSSITIRAGDAAPHVAAIDGLDDLCDLTMTRMCSMST